VTSLTEDLTQQMEAIQKCAIRIIFNFTRDSPYSSMLFAANLSAMER